MGAIISLKTTCPCRPYVTTWKAMNFNEVFLALPVVFVVFDVTSLKNAAEQLHYPELSRESLRT